MIKTFKLYNELMNNKEYIKYVFPNEIGQFMFYLSQMLVSVMMATLITMSMLYTYFYKIEIYKEFIILTVILFIIYKYMNEVNKDYIIWKNDQL